MKQGEAVCGRCAGLPNDQNFLGRVSGLITDMDMAEYLHAHMFNSESVEKMEETLRESANCKYRCKTAYNAFLKLPLEKLHRKVRCSWGGRAAHKLTASLDLFAAQFVRPCLDTDPNAPLKSASLIDCWTLRAMSPNCPKQIALWSKVLSQVTFHDTR